MANLANEELTVHQLRAMDYEYASRFAQLVSATVSDIVSKTDDLAIRDRAMRWRMWAMPEARSAAFDQDPVAGLIELWILAQQQHHFFTEGNGSTWFGEHQPLAERTTRHLVDEAEQLLESVMSPDEHERMREGGARWVEAHPIEGKLYVRPTGRADLAALVPEAKSGGLKAVGSMEETLRDLSDRVTILSQQTPVEFRWQAEYLVDALFEERVHGRIDSIVGSMEELTAFLDSFEETLTLQTQTLLGGIEQERLMVFDAVAQERDAIIGAVEEQGDSLLGELDRHVEAATQELDTVGRGLIDHFFLRLIEVLVVMGIVVVLTVLLVLFVLRRRDAARIDRNPPTE